MPLLSRGGRDGAPRRGQGALACALTRRQFIDRHPRRGGARQRPRQGRRDARARRRLDDPELELRAHAYRLHDYMELGDIASAERELAATRRLAKRLRQPQHLWHVPLLRGTRALIDGPLRGGGLARGRGARRRRARREPLAQQFYAIQIAPAPAAPGARRGDARDAVAEMAERYPAIARLALRARLARAQTWRSSRRPARCSNRSPPTASAMPRDAQCLVCAELARGRRLRRSATRRARPSSTMLLGHTTG